MDDSLHISNTSFNTFTNIQNKRDVVKLVSDPIVMFSNNETCLNYKY